VFTTFLYTMTHWLGCSLPISAFHDNIVLPHYYFQYTCFSVSRNFLIFGATSGGLYVFRREPCIFLQLLPNKVISFHSLCERAEEAPSMMVNLVNYLFEGHRLLCSVLPLSFPHISPNSTTSVSQTSTRIPIWIHYSANEVWANVCYLNLFFLHVFIFILILFLFSCQYYTTMLYIRIVPPSVLCNLRM